jgi:DHA3 family macrolide efflux protein-like MFS transporter
MDQLSVEINQKKWTGPFFTIWSGQAVSLLGSQLVQFALIWWLTKTTGSATVLATATLVGMLPQVLLGPVAGALVDRWNRRLVMIVADSLVALATLGLAMLFWSGNVQIWHVYLLMFVRGLGGGFHWAAMQASTSLMVPKDHLSRIQGMNQMLNGAMNIGSAPLGALLLVVLPMQNILMIDIVTAAVAVTTLFVTPIPQPKRLASPENGAGKGSLLADMRAGLNYVWTWPGLVIILVMATLINLLLTPASSLMPILVTDHFGGQALQLAWMEAAWGIGVVVGGLTLSAWGSFRRRVITSLLGLLLLGTVMSLIGFAPGWAFWLAVFLMFVAGFCNPIINGPLFAVIQAVVAPDMQGRVFTLMASVSSAMTPLGLLIAGPTADLFGVRSWYVVGGVITALLGVGAFFVPAILHIEEDRRSVETQVSSEAQTRYPEAGTSRLVEIAGG